jgi:hypothetical protein
MPGAQMELMLSAAVGDWQFKYGTEEKQVIGVGSAPAFQNSWTANSATVQFRRNSDGLVTIEGAVQKNSNINGTIFTLPVGYRPSANKYFPITVWDASTGYAESLQISGGGNLTINALSTPSASPNIAYISCSFYAD